ncbi:MAG TPA: hypothetical protein DD723_02785 [Candidatus Omnitrophica bacterium]|nr:MAG: hypothetical protein A2Z81_01495 [Omnitrophica WOR_2 bacterium GWA2_45_18]HBR14453.1 hypothetical protein [Candidatus Omnitrophota bacterium]
MTSRLVDVRARKDKILGITIDQYIKTVSPVSSMFLATEYNLELSPASIRNILAELEEDGYLTHPHTSAGRIPTQMGYRYYVDHLMDEIQLLEEEKQRIKAEVDQNSMELEELLDKTSRVLSDTTHYTSIISVDGWGNKVFCCGTSFIVDYPEYQDIKKIGNILTALDEKEQLLGIINQDLAKKINIYIGHEMACSEINSCSLVVSRYRSKEGTTGRLAVLGPTRMNYEHVVSAIDYLSHHLMEEIL